MSLWQNLKAVIRLEEFQSDPVERRLAHAASVADLRRVARRRLPGGVFDYVDGGSDDERTLARNTDAFAGPCSVRGCCATSAPSTFRPRCSASRSPTHSPSHPRGSRGIVHPDGELAVARAAARHGLPYTLSTLSTCSIEEVRAASEGRLWFQVYAWRDRGLVKEMITRCAEARYEALVLTVDTAMLGRRERYVRRGFSMPPSIGPRTFVDGALHPQWTLSFLRSDPIRFANVLGRDDVGDGATPVKVSDYINTQFDPALSWSDVEWLQANWDGPIILKGIQSVADAVIAADMGVAGVALSNHGGRQLDGSPAPFSLVAPVADAVGDRTAVICDGGVRRGSDIVKAVAAGATACMAGRAYLYALAAGGERGVDRVLSWFENDMVRTMTLLGASKVAELDAALLEPTGAGL